MNVVSFTILSESSLLVKQRSQSHWTIRSKQNEILKTENVILKDEIGSLKSRKVRLEKKDSEAQVLNLRKCTVVTLPYSVATQCDNNLSKRITNFLERRTELIIKSYCKNNVWTLNMTPYMEIVKKN